MCRSNGKDSRGVKYTVSCSQGVPGRGGRWLKPADGTAVFCNRKRAIGRKSCAKNHAIAALRFSRVLSEACLKGSGLIWRFCLFRKKMITFFLKFSNLKGKCYSILSSMLNTDRLGTQAAARQSVLAKIRRRRHRYRHVITT